MWAEGGELTISGADWNAADISCHHLIDHVEHCSFHTTSEDVLVCAQTNGSQRLSQPVRLIHIHGDEFQYSILCDDTDYHGPLRLRVIADQGYPPRPAHELFAQGIVQDGFWTRRYGLWALYFEDVFDLFQVAEQ